MEKSELNQVAVIGAGTMGHGIAQVAATVCSRVVLYDVDEARVEAGLAKVRAHLDKGVDLGKVPDEARERVLEALQGSVSLEETARGADLVIEAVPEVMDLKLSLFKDLKEVLSRDAILATNTSSLSIDALAGGVPEPSRFLGLHFFNPVHIMALVEVVRGGATADSVLKRALAFAREIGKEPIVVRDSPGFASSRLGVALGLEAIRMVESEVASPADIDKAMALGYRHPMGPLRLTDLVGLDVRLGIAEYLHEALGSEAFRPPELLRAMVAEGKLGKKSGRGFYDWSDA